MKKTIKLIAVIVMLGVSIFALSGCGTSRYRRAMQNIENTKEQIRANMEALNEQRANMVSVNDIAKNAIENSKNDTTTNVTKSVDRTPVDITSNDAYYFVINGVKYTAGSPMSSLSNSGYHLNKTGAEKDLQPNGYLITGDGMLNSDNSTCFYCTPFNSSKETVKGADATIGGFSIDDYNMKKFNGTIEITNGITIGTSLDDIVAVFGEPTSKTDATEYSGPTYSYSVSGQYKSFTFRFDKENKVTSIRWQDFIFQ